MAVTEELRILIKAEADKAVKNFKKLRGEFDKTEKSAGKMGKLITAAGTAMIAAFGAKKILDIGRSMVQTAADIETAAASFEVLLGSADASRAIMADIQRFSASTPFKLPELQNAAKRMLAFGTASGDVVEKMGQLGNLAQGNSQMLERLTLAYGKVQAKGKASLEELNMFTEAGVPIMKELQKQYGVTQDEMFKLISTGKVGFKEVDDAVRSMTTGEGQFAGMLEKQSKTLNGIMSTLQDNVQLLGASLGQLLLPATKKLAGNLTDIISTMNELISAHTRYRELARKDHLTFDERRQKVEADLIRTQAIIKGLERDRLVMFTTGQRYYKGMVAQAKALADEMERYNDAQKEANEAATVVAQLIRKEGELAKLQLYIDRIRRSDMAERLLATEGVIAMLARIEVLSREIADLTAESTEAMADLAEEEARALRIAEAHAKTPQGELEALEELIESWENMTGLTADQKSDVNDILNGLYDQLEAARDQLGVHIDANAELEKQEKTSGTIAENFADIASSAETAADNIFDMAAPLSGLEKAVEGGLLPAVQDTTAAVWDLDVASLEAGEAAGGVASGWEEVAPAVEAANDELDMLLPKIEAAAGHIKSIYGKGDEPALKRKGEGRQPRHKDPVKMARETADELEKWSEHIRDAENAMDSLLDGDIRGFIAPITALFGPAGLLVGIAMDGLEALVNAIAGTEMVMKVSDSIGHLLREGIKKADWDGIEEALSAGMLEAAMDAAFKTAALQSYIDHVAYAMTKYAKAKAEGRTGFRGEEWWKNYLDQAIRDLGDAAGEAAGIFDDLMDGWGDAFSGAADDFSAMADTMEDDLQDLLGAINETFDEEIYLLKHLLEQGMIDVDEYIRRVNAWQAWRNAQTESATGGGGVTGGSGGLIPSMPLLSAAPTGGPTYNLTVIAPTGNAEEIARVADEGFKTLDRRRRL